MLTIEQLRKSGWKVRSSTYRYCEEYGKQLVPISAVKAMGLQAIIRPKGGKIQIVAQKDNKTYIAESLCSINDSFNKKEGTKIALERLEKQIEEKVC